MNLMNPLFACLRAPRPTAIVVDVAREFSPRLQRQGPGCVVCDVSGLGRLLGAPAAIGAELARAVSAGGDGIRVSIAPTVTTARLLTLAYDGLSVVVDDEASALAALPLAHLQQLVAESQGTTLLRASSTMSGQEAARKRYVRAFDMARRWGLTTIGELAALPSGDLSARMGQDGVLIQQLAHGRDPGPLVPDPDIPRFIGRMELEWPIDTLEPLSFVLARLLEPLAVSLERADRAAAALRLDLRLVDRTVHTRALQLPAAMRDPRVLRTLLQLDLESHPPAAAVDIVTIEIDPAPGRVIQYSLLERALPSAETVATLTARLGALVGETRCGTAVLLDTHRPDGFDTRRFELPDRPLEHAGRRKASGSGLQAPDVSSCSVPTERRRRASSTHRTNQAARSPEPGARSLLEPAARSPEPVLPPMLRRFRPPVAVRVTVSHGRPAQIAVDRRGMPGGAVDTCAGPWRTSGAWWDPEPVRWDRDEWDVALRDGTLCRLFCERDTGTWFLEGMLD